MTSFRIMSEISIVLKIIRSNYGYVQVDGMDLVNDDRDLVPTLKNF